MNGTIAKRYDLYISYSRADRDIACRIFDHLSAVGISTFFDDTVIQSGDEFAEVTRAIDSSRLVLYLCSDHSMQSSWATNEIKYALAKGIQVVPVLIDDARLPDELMFFLGNINGFTFNSTTAEEDIRNIASGLTKLLIKCDHEENSTLEPDIQPNESEDCKTLEYCNGEDEEEEDENEDFTSHKHDTFPHIQQHSQDYVPLEPTEPNSAKNRTTIWLIIAFLVSFALEITGITLVSSSKYEYSNVGPALIFIGLAILLIVAIAALAAFLDNLQRSLHLVTLYCNTEKKGHISTITVKVYDRTVATITGEGVARFKVKRGGKYLISIKSADSDLEVEKFEYDTNKETSGDIKYVTLKKYSDTSPVQKSTDTSDITNYRCFIAGSTRLVNERNATRAVLSILYNKWEKYKLVISSYTFEDFSNGYTVGGQQIKYNEFIQDIADCTIFIVENGIGDKTLEEYKLAIATFKKNLKRPKVYVYANNLNNDSTTLTFIEEVRRNRSYWREYSNISELMSKIKEDIDAELFNIFVINNKHS